jgi:hypothetical protein
MGVGRPRPMSSAQFVQLVFQLIDQNP